MPRERVGYVHPDLTVETLSDALARRASPSGAKVRRDRLVGTSAAIDLPIVEGALGRGVYAGPAPRSQKFQLPGWHIARDADERPQVSLTYLADVSDPTMGVAELTVDLHPGWSAAPDVRPLPHTVDLALIFFTVAPEVRGARLGERFAFDRVIEQPDGRLRAILRIQTLEMLTRIGGAMSQRAHRARLELTIRADVLRKQPRLALGKSTLNDARLHRRVLAVRGRLIPRVAVASPAARRHVASRVKHHVARVESAAGIERVRPSETADAAVATPGADASSAVVAGRMVETPRAIAREAVARLEADLQRRVVERARMHRLEEPVASRRVRHRHVEAATRTAVFGPVPADAQIVEALAASDLQVFGRKAIAPLAIHIGERASHLRQSISTRRHLRFWFDRADHPEVYQAVPGMVPEVPFTLVRRVVQFAGRDYAFFQDSQRLDTFYYLPEAYRLARAEEAPFDPLMLIGLNEVLLEGEQSPVLTYAVEVGFWLEPVLSPALRAAAQAALPASRPDTAIALLPFAGPVKSVSLPGLVDDFEASAVRTRATTLAHSIEVTFEMQHEQLAALTAAFTQPRPFLTGMVETTIRQAGQPVTVPIDVSFFQTHGDVFSQVAEARVEPPGTVELKLRNGLDAPVTVHWTSLETSEQDAQVHLDPATPPTQQIGAHGHLVLRGTTTPADLPLARIQPLVQAQISTWSPSLLARLMVVPGYPSMTHDVEVHVEPIHFEAAEGDAPPLTAITVEFLDQTSVVLTPLEPSAVVQLRISVLAALADSGGDAPRRYVYRVRDQHGSTDGASTAWRAAVDARLEVVPAHLGECG